MYFWSYRDEGAFHEKVTNTIVDDIVRRSQPRFVRITPSGTCAAASHQRRRRAPQAGLEGTGRRCDLTSRRSRRPDADCRPAALPGRAARPCRPGIIAPMNPLLDRAAPLPVRAAARADARHHAEPGRSADQPGHRRAAARRRPRLIEAGADRATWPAWPRYPATAGEPALREAIAGWVERRYGVDARPGDAGAAGQRLARGAVRVRADRDRPDARRARPWSARTRSIRSTKARRCWPAPQPAFVNSDPARNFAPDWRRVPDDDLGAHAAALRLLARQPDRRGDAAGRVAARCSS